MAKSYTHTRWRKKREVILKRDGYRCRECKRYGKSKGAEQVHHVKPVKNNPELWFVNNNLISLCTSCHNKCHDRNTNELTQYGIDLMNRIYKSNPPPIF